jgi:hypothetical protein
VKINTLCSNFRLIGCGLCLLLISMTAGCRFSSNTEGSLEGNSANANRSAANSVAADEQHGAPAQGSNTYPNEDAPAAASTPVAADTPVVAGTPPSVNSPGANAPPATSQTASSPLLISWSFSPSQYRGNNGKQYNFRCPPGGKPNSVLGTDVYTDDSSVCTAAVHEGLITTEEGGVVTIEIRPGLDAYVGSERNRIKSSDFNVRWSGSFVFVRSSSGGS